MLNFRKNIKSTVCVGINLIPFVNVMLLVLAVFVISLSVSVFSTTQIRLPKAVTSDANNEDNIVIVVTGENIFYYNGRVVTLIELKDVLGKAYNKGKPVLVKADRMASVGRLVDLWTLGREQGVGRINIVTDQGL